MARPKRRGNCFAATVKKPLVVSGVLKGLSLQPRDSPFASISAQLCAGGDLIVHHNEVQDLLPLLGVGGGEQHTAALETHHLARRQVDDGDQRLADELRLNEAGFKVTQATVSRDIRALKMTKVAGKDGKSRYAILQDTQPGLGDQYTRVLNDAVVSIEVGQNLVVIKTVTGMAMGVATALDALKWPEILGCIAGDDTIMCACKSSELAEGVMEKLGSILNRR